jgi:hypothetical protein
MAEPNKLRITHNDQGTEVLVSDAQGVVHDISGKFRQISGTTSPGAITNTITFQDNGTAVSIDYTAIDKELNFTLKPETAKQIAALAD